MTNPARIPAYLASTWLLLFTKSYNKSFTKFSQSGWRAWYWSRSLFACSWTLNLFQWMKRVEKELGQYPIRWPCAWSIILTYGISLIGGVRHYVVKTMMERMNYVGCISYNNKNLNHKEIKNLSHLNPVAPIIQKNFATLIHSYTEKMSK